MGRDKGKERGRNPLYLLDGVALPPSHLADDVGVDAGAGVEVVTPNPEVVTADPREVVLLKDRIEAEGRWNDVDLTAGMVKDGEGRVFNIPIVSKEKEEKGKKEFRRTPGAPPTSS
jgi:hypothetical protein